MQSLRLFIVISLAAVASSCSGPQPSEEPPPAPETAEAPPEPAEPRFELIAFSGEGLIRGNGSGTGRQVLAAGARFGGFVSRAPDGRAVAFTYSRGDSLRLARLDLDDDRLRDLHAAETGTRYTTAWAPDASRLLYGWETGASGDVVISTPGGLADPGCSASTVAAHWPDDEQLVTGDAENRYVVDASTCETLASVDVRKMHHIVYPPAGGAMAYVYRDLVYDRDNREYVPDSALYVADLDGAQAEELFDYEYRPRNPTWSPDGSTLAFDVRLQDPPHRRRIVLKERSGGFTYVVAPSDFSEADVVRPVWSPSGRHVAFDLVRNGRVSKAVRTFGQTTVLAADADSTWGWIDDETVVFVTASDSVRAVSIDGEERFTLGPDVALLHARSVDRPASSH